MTNKIGCRGYAVLGEDESLYMQPLVLRRFANTQNLCGTGGNQPVKGEGKPAGNRTNLTTANPSVSFNIPDL